MGSFKKYILLLAFPAVLVILMASCSSSKRIASDKGQEEGYDTIKVGNLLIEAKKQQLLGNHQQASELFAQLIQLAPQDPVAYYEMGRMHRLYKRFDQGLGYAKKACSLDPGNKWYILLQAELEMELMHYEDAADSYGKAIELSPEDPDLFLHCAAALSHAGKYKQAIATYDELEVRFGLNEDVSYQKYRLYHLLKNIPGAVGELQALIDSSPGDIRYYGALADFYTDLKRYKEARGLYATMLNIDPENPYVYLAMSDFYLRTGEPDSASASLMEAFRSKRLDIDSKMKVLLELYEKGDDTSPEAYRLIDTMLNVHPQDAKAWSIYGDFLVRDARLEEASDAFRRVTEIDSLRYPVWEQLLLLDSKLDDHQALVSDGQRTIDLFPEQSLPYLLTGAGFIYLKQYPEAISILERGLYFVSNETLEKQFYTYLGDAYYRNGNMAQSFRSYDRLLELDPNNSLILNNYSYQLASGGGDLEKADKMSARAAQLDPTNPSNLDTRAWVMFLQKDYPGALIWIEKALANGGDSNPNIVEHHGDILFHLGRISEARESWFKASGLGPGSNNLEIKLKEGTYVE